jgi:hypothetical protein
MRKRNTEMRRRVAVEAARLISETGLRDYGQARRKAAARCGARHELEMPRNTEIEAALREHQSLFQADSQPRVLHDLREAAREAVRFFAAFEPRLVGAVLDGSADAHSAVCLHLHTDRVNDVVAHLHEHAIAFEEIDRKLRYVRDRLETFPAFRFAADDTAFDITVLPLDRLRQAPFDRIDDRPMRRVALAQLEALLEKSPEKSTGTRPA